MKIKIKSIIIASLIILGLGVGYYFLFSAPDKAGNTVADNAFGWKFPVTKFPLTGPNNIAYSTIRTPGATPEGFPVRLQIPAIGVDSKIEDALITPDGRMDVPQGSVNVAWFALGPHPGDTGSAVIGGHFGIRNGIKFVFYDLDKLRVGDKIYVVNDKGDTLAFQVRSIKLFDRNADATTVFTSDDGLAHLNLITCEGIWNRINGNYPERRVVFTDSIPAEGIAPMATTTFHPTLRIGTHGADVVKLQNALIQKGFLVVSSSVADGFFGALTRNAVIQYQTSVGLSSDGFFGPLTRIKLFPVVLAANPTLPQTAISPSENLEETLPQTFIEYIKNLYRTPIDGFITSILIFAILFISFKIFKK